MKSKRNKLTLMIFSIILISTIAIAYILMPMNLTCIILFLTYVILEIFIFRFWVLSTYGFVCVKCGYAFNIGVLKRIVSFKKDKRCPRCQSENIVKERFGQYCLNEWIDSEED